MPDRSGTGAPLVPFRADATFASARLAGRVHYPKSGLSTGRGSCSPIPPDPPPIPTTGREAFLSVAHHLTPLRPGSPRSHSAIHNV